MLAAGGFEVHLFGESGEKPGLPFGLAGDGRGGAVGGKVEERPEFHEPVQAVETEWVLVPAGAEGGGEVAEAGAVDLLDPGSQPGKSLFTFVAGELPPPGRWRWLVGAIVTIFPGYGLGPGR